MFRIVCAFLILAGALPVNADAASKHTGDVGKVRQVASLLEGISTKIASEREKENVVYGKLKSYCKDTRASAHSVVAPQAAADSDDDVQDNTEQLEADDATAVDQLASVVKAAIPNDNQTLPALPTAMPQAKQALANSKDTLHENAEEALQQAQAATEQTPKEQAVPASAANKAVVPKKDVVPASVKSGSSPQQHDIVNTTKGAGVEDDPQITAVESEFDETANEVASLQRSLAPRKPMSLATTADEVKSAAVSEAVDDLDGSIPNIDQQALQLYNTFGGEEPATLDTLGSLSSGPGFLQVVQRHQHNRRLAPALQADIDAAMQALEAIAKDTTSAMNTLNLLRNADESDADSGGSASDTSSITEQCTSLLQELESRQNNRAKQQTELQQRSQRLLESLPDGHDRTGAPKRLRSH